MKNLSLASCILPLVAGSVAVLGSTAPAHALTWNWSYNSTAAYTGYTVNSITAGGTFTTTDVASGGNYAITGITGTVGGATIKLLIDPNGYEGNDNLLSTSATISNGGVSFIDSNSDSWNLYISNGNGILDDGFRTSYTSGNLIITEIPFDIPGGATIPALGSVVTLGVMRKARKFTANKQLSIQKGDRARQLAQKQDIKVVQLQVGVPGLPLV